MEDSILLLALLDLAGTILDSIYTTTGQDSYILGENLFEKSYMSHKQLQVNMA